METRPPALSGAIVRLLIPPACREHVLGDLWERYRSPGQFVRDAIQTVPLVVFSQMRRVFDPLRLLMLVLPAFVLFGGLLPAAATRPAGWIRAALPTTAVALALLLRETYRGLGPWNTQRAMTDALFTAGAAVLTQALVLLVRPDWLVDTRSLLAGAAGTLTWVFVLRLRSPIEPDTLRLSPEGRLAPEALARDVTRFERTIRQRNAVEYLGGALVAVGFALALWRGPGVVIRLGAALVIVGTLFVLYRIRTRGTEPGILLTGELSAAITAYRAGLIRQKQLLETVTWWYLLPLAPGMLLLTIGHGLQQQHVWPPLRVLGLFVVVALTTRALNRQVASKVQQKIDLLTTALRHQ